MSTEKPRPQEQPTQEEIFKEYQKQASDFAAGILSSRSGYGSYRHFDGIFHESFRLVMGSSRIRSNLYFEPPGIPYLYDLELAFHLLRHYRRGWGTSSLRFFIENLLGSPASYEPPALWVLFWALAKAEHNFLYRYVPFWSNEERLTGHLVSQMIERLEEFSDHWNSLSRASEPPISCKVSYIDTATARSESLTGADLGLIIHANFPGQEEFLKVARFQAKKAESNGKARIDLDQAQILLQAEKLSYYLYYHPFQKTSWSLAPTVRRVSAYKEEIEKAIEESHKASTKKRKITIDTHDHGCDLATFITFALADLTADHGVPAEDGPQAVRMLMAQAPPLLSRVLIVTLGHGEPLVLNWEELLREYIGFGEG